MILHVAANNLPTIEISYSKHENSSLVLQAIIWKRTFQQAVPTAFPEKRQRPGKSNTSQSKSSLIEIGIVIDGDFALGDFAGYRRR